MPIADKLFAHKAYTYEYKCRLGEVIIEANICEILIGQALAFATKTKADLIRNPIFAKPVSENIKALLQIETLPQYLIDALHRAQDIMNQRNLLVHGFPHSVTDEGHVRVGLKGMARNKHKAINVAALDALLVQFSELLASLAKYSHENGAFRLDGEPRV